MDTGQVHICTVALANTQYEIKDFCIDFNWGKGWVNGFAEAGLWADADPKNIAALARVFLGRPLEFVLSK